MAGTERKVVGRVEALWRYPVKSMLGEQVTAGLVGGRGLAGDRRLALVDRETGSVATAKNPRRWRSLLEIRAETLDDGDVLLHLPGGRAVVAGDPKAADVLSEFLGRPVSVAAEAAPGARLERAAPEEVLERGVEADVEVTTIEVAAASPPGTFFDFSPMQFVTTASLERAGTFHPAGRVDAVRYRPNIVIRTDPALAGFVENDWVGRRLHLGPEVVLEVLVPSPRCAVPTLAHGSLPRDPDALRVPARHNYVEVPIDGFGAAPCLGAHAAVAQGGLISAGDEVWLAAG